MLKKIFLICTLMTAAGLTIADEVPEQPVTITRAALQSLSPLVVTAVEEIEAQRGRRIRDDELTQLLESEEFAAKFKQVRKDFCADAANRQYVMCMAEEHTTVNKTGKQ